ncbi:right-handed parallel beta-helix repeat-containing protein [Klebsiella pneumoniae]|uniref:right-handed parallel beta-helix repeat-containing protein n=2 Tax=Klebsiella pneumoniae TaxID=573 RepID=UPI001BD47994|nr:right-handed parallel beta-helix repeat-containing protein [Klebsiella pneumoniae]MCQ8333791.1 right-handed parallel beta-helix repeat-containing protein [Klebsiella pneumoniae]QVR15256.1 right-handed parallel beta-helix repeat-containing protein [Klebsiella pneumoniae]
MTVSTEVDHNDYTGNGVTTSFPYTFRIFKKSDLTVQVADLNDNITVLTLDTDYSVTGAGTYSGGNVVLMSPLANGWQISISRDLPVTQETDLRNQGKFFAEVHEDAFDKLTMLIQQCFSFLRLALRKPSFIANYYDALNNRIRNLRDPSQAQDAATKNYVDGQINNTNLAWQAGDEILNQKIDNNFLRTIRIPESSVKILPTITGRKNKIMAFDDIGDPIAVLPESGSAADVLIELAASDGIKLIGQCPDLTALRTIEPTISNQRICVASYSPGWAGLIGAPVGGGEFYYDPNDTTSADDDIFVFVTAGGKRWKRACSGKKICLEWKGVRPGDDAAPALNAIGAYLNSRAVAKGTVSGLPRVHVGAGVYPLSDTVKLTYAFRIKAVGNVEFTATGWDSTVAKDIFTIANPANMPAVPDKGYASGDPWLNGSDGTILITGPVYDAAVTNNVVGVGVGNLVTGRAPVRGNVMHGVSIRYCGSAIYLRMRRLYLTSFSHVHCELNNTHITCPNQSGTEDSGERIAFHECVFGGCRNQHVYVYMAPALHFESCSFDFAQGSGIYLDGISEYGLFSFTNCHFENFNNYLINAQTGSRITILITNCDVFNNSQTTPVTAASASSPSRPMFNLANGGNVSINGFKLNYSYRPLGSLNMLVSSGTQTADTRTRVSVNGLTAGDKAMTPCPAAAHIMNRSNDFSGEAVGSTITSKIAYTTTHVQPVQDIASSWGAGMSASVVADGSTKVLQMVSADNTNFGYIQPKTAIPVSPGRSYSAYFSVQKLLATGGVNWSVSYLWYDKDGNLLSNDSALSGQFSSVYNDTTLPGYSTDAAENGNRKLSTTMCVRIAPPGAAYCRPYFSVSSFTGTINIVNFLMWEYQ